MARRRTPVVGETGGHRNAKVHTQSQAFAQAQTTVLPGQPAGSTISFRRMCDHFLPEPGLFQAQAQAIRGRYIIAQQLTRKSAIHTDFVNNTHRHVAGQWPGGRQAAFQCLKEPAAQRLVSCPRRRALPSAVARKQPSNGEVSLGVWQSSGRSRNSRDDDLVRGCRSAVRTDDCPGKAGGAWMAALGFLNGVFGSAFVAQLQHGKPEQLRQCASSSGLFA
jgi:hypothetical protein